MRRILSIFMLLISACMLAYGQASSSTARHIFWAATTPSTCSPGTGDVYFKTTATVGPYYCDSANHWAAMFGAGGSVSFTDLTSGTNITAAMVVGAGASLTVSGSGTINSTSLGGAAAALYARLASPAFTGTVTLPAGQILTTPNIGVATATSVNKVTITAPATSAILTIANGKTATISNTLTFTGTDSSSVAFGAGGTVLYDGGALGTPSSITLTNGTGLPAAAILAGSFGIGNYTIQATLGSELAPALTAGNWTVGSGWESPIVGPGLIKNANGTGTQTPSAATTIVATTTYKVVITLSAWSVGSAIFSLGGVTSTVSLAAATTYTDYIVAGTTGKLIITPTSTSRFTISAISIKAISVPGSLNVEGPMSVAGLLRVAANVIAPMDGYFKVMNAAGTASRAIGYDSSLTALTIGSLEGGVAPLDLRVAAGSSPTGAVRETAAGNISRNVALTSTPNATIKQTLGCANFATTDTLNIACLGAANNTAVSIDAGGADISSSPMFSLTLNDRTTKTFKLARDGYALTYNNTTVAGTGVAHIPTVVASTGQTATIGTTNLQCTVAGVAGVCPAGVYRVSVYTDISTIGTGTLTSTIAWSDPAAARTITSAGIAATATNYERVEYTIKTDGVANITYATTRSVADGVYAIYVTLERLQ